MFHLFQLTIKQMKKIKNKRDKSESTSPGEGFSEPEILKLDLLQSSRLSEPLC